MFKYCDWRRNSWRLGYWGSSVPCGGTTFNRTAESRRFYTGQCHTLHATHAQLPSVNQALTLYFIFIYTFEVRSCHAIPRCLVERRIRCRRTKLTERTYARTPEASANPGPAEGYGRGRERARQGQFSRPEPKLTYKPALHLSRALACWMCSDDHHICMVFGPRAFGCLCWGSVVYCAELRSTTA